MEIDNVLIEQADAAGRHHRSDRPWLDGAVKPVIGVLTVSVEIERPRAKRVSTTSRQPVTQRSVSLRFSGDHVVRGTSSGPFGLACNGGFALKIEGFLLLVSDRDFNGAATERIIWPTSLGLIENQCYVAGWCELRQDFRTFVLIALNMPISDPSAMQAVGGDLVKKWRSQVADEGTEHAST